MLRAIGNRRARCRLNPLMHVRVESALLQAKLRLDLTGVDQLPMDASYTARVRLVLELMPVVPVRQMLALNSLVCLPSMVCLVLCALRPRWKQQTGCTGYTADTTDVASNGGSQNGSDGSMLAPAAGQGVSIAAIRWLISLCRKGAAVQLHMRTRCRLCELLLLEAWHVVTEGQGGSPRRAMHLAALLRSDALKLEQRSKVVGHLTRHVSVLSVEIESHLERLQEARSCGSGREERIPTSCCGDSIMGWRGGFFGGAKRGWTDATSRLQRLAESNNGRHAGPAMGASLVFLRRLFSSGGDGKSDIQSATTWR